MTRSPRLRFRSFEPADLASVCPWLEAAGLAFPRRAEPERWVERLRGNPRIVCRAAMSDARRLVGFYRLDLAPDSTAEVTILVAPEHRGEGLGTALLEAALSEARRLSLRGLVATVRHGHHIALRFFQDAGFEEQGDAPPGFVRLFRVVHRGQRLPPLEIAP